MGRHSAGRHAWLWALAVVLLIAALVTLWFVHRAVRPVPAPPTVSATSTPLPPPVPTATPVPNPAPQPPPAKAPEAGDSGLAPDAVTIPPR